MKRYLLDSGIMDDFIDHRRGVPEKAREAQERGSRIGTCMPVVAELFYGMEFSATRDENLRRLRRALSRVVCWPLDRAAAEEYGRVAAALRRMGRKLQTVGHHGCGDHTGARQPHRSLHGQRPPGGAGPGGRDLGDVRHSD